MADVQVQGGGALGIQGSRFSRRSDGMKIRVTSLDKAEGGSLRGETSILWGSKKRLETPIRRGYWKGSSLKRFLPDLGGCGNRDGQDDGSRGNVKRRSHARKLNFLKGKKDTKDLGQKKG